MKVFGATLVTKGTGITSIVLLAIENIPLIDTNYMAVHFITATVDPIQIMVLSGLGTNIWLLNSWTLFFISSREYSSLQSLLTVFSILCIHCIPFHCI